MNHKNRAGRRDPTSWTSAELFDPMDNALNLSNRGRSEVDYLTPFRALDAPVERCEVSRPVSRVAPLVFLAPALCSSGRALAGNHTSPLTASLASLAVPLVSPDTGGRVTVGAVTGAPVTVGLGGAL